MKRIILLLISGVMLFSVQGFSQSIRYVKPDGTALAQNAVSWASACSDLQAVINVSQYGDIIWVAQGTYKPLRQAYNLSMIDQDNRSNAFVLKSGVKIYGGFAGNETSLEQRALPIAGSLNGSILSGDIGIVGDNADNCFHVVISAGDSTDAGTLDGFVITGGNANDDHKMTVNTKVLRGIYGGGIYIINSSPTLTNTIIHNNIANNNSGGVGASNGGGIFIDNSSPTLTNTIIHNNIADYGSGIAINNNSEDTCFPVFTNCTFSNNAASYDGGAIYTVNKAYLHIRNTIIWGNIANSDPAISGTNYSLHYSIVQGTTASGTNLGNVNPRFLNTGIGDYRLLANSPAINAGSNAYFHADSTPNLSHITKDLKGSPRFANNTVDIGAYEYIAPAADANGVIYATTNGRTTGQSWTDAIGLADALWTAQKDTTIKQIWVAKGTYAPLYNPESSIHPRQNTFILAKNIKLYGGFAGGETSINDRDWENNKTILSGIMGSDTAYHVVVAAGELGDVLVDGFTITDGNALTVSGTTSINGRTIYKNNGGALYVNIENSELALQNCNFVNNRATNSGGAIYSADSSKISISDTKMENNQAGKYAGALFNAAKSQAKINRCLFSGNTAKLLGGAIHSTGPLTVTNSLLTYNNSENGGAFDFYGKATLVNITMANNTATIAGGGIHIRSGNVNMQNSILYNNTAPENGNLNRVGGTLNVSYCALNDIALPATVVDSGNNLMSIDPLFVDDYNDYRLQTGSRCVNAGSNDLYLSACNVNDFSNEIDFAGNPRLLNETIDIGAYEGSITNVKEIASSVNLLLYPNPVQNALYFQTAFEVEQITLYDISGRMIKQIQNPFGSIEVNDLANGIYLVKVKTKEREIVRKIVKE